METKNDNVAKVFKLLIFAKSRQTAEGKQFFTYLSSLTRKTDGEVITVQVKFRQECGQPNPQKCPRYIEVKQTDCNFTEKTLELDDGFKTARTLWVSAWKDAGDYIDESMNDFV